MSILLILLPLTYIHGLICVSLPTITLFLILNPLATVHSPIRIPIYTCAPLQIFEPFASVRLLAAWSALFLALLPIVSANAVPFVPFVKVAHVRVTRDKLPLN